MNSDRDATQSPTPAADPVCGMSLDPARAAGSAVHEGQTYYFCSTHCLHQFQADPRRYAGSRATEPPAASASPGTI
jgi:Cu+-exporting ATPase